MSTGSTRPEDYLVWAPFSQMKQVNEVGPRVMVKAEGTRVTDIDGKEYLDGHASLWLVNVGYGRKEIVEAVFRQMQELPWFSSFMGFSNLPAMKLAERLIALAAPEGMGRVFFSGSGSEAMETALKIVRQYWRLKGKGAKYKVISRQKAYHGVTFGAMSATGMTPNRRLFEPLVPGFSHIPAPDCYHCPFKQEYPACGMACAQALEAAIQHEGADTVAAFVAEPVQAAGGVIIPPPEYLPMVREICTRHEVLYIDDEVVCGFGRTGTMFGARTYGIKPDIMVCAKGVTSGYIPLGVTLATDEVYETFLGDSGQNKELRHGNTYSGHPTACAAAMANLDIVEREDLSGRARTVGAHFLVGLQGLMRHRTVGHVAGVGLLARVELVADKATHASFPATVNFGGRVQQKMFELGVIVRNVGDVITYSPPLILSEAEADQLVAVTDAAITAIEDEVLGK